MSHYQYSSIVYNTGGIIRIGIDGYFLIGDNNKFYRKEAILCSLFDCKYGIKTTQSFQLIFHNELYNSFRMQHFVGLDSTTLILWSDGKVLEVEICCECLQLLSINVQLLVMGYTSLNIMLCLVMMMQKWSQTCNPAPSSTQHWVFYKM